MSTDGNVGDNLPRCGGPGGKIILTREEAREWLRHFRAHYGAGRGQIYQCPWSGAVPHYHHTKKPRNRNGGKKGRRR